MKRDELWRVRGSRSELRELRIEEGQALTLGRAGGTEIRARDDFAHRFSDRFADPAAVVERLRDDHGEQVGMLPRIVEQAALAGELHLRVVSVARYVENEERSDLSRATTAIILARHEGVALSLAVDAATVAQHLQLLLEEIRPRERIEIDYRAHPIVWRQGSGAVLLHEAVGHPAELSSFAEWPEWLEVVDDPAAAGIGRMQIDDAAQLTELRTLTHRQKPSAFRRESFRAAPLRRMTNFVVRSSRQAADLPQPRIEILLVGGGSYDPLSDTVRLSISSARLIDGSRARSLKPFELVEQRESIRRRLAAAFGAPATYPGIVCADEGQRLPVGTIAPDLLTTAFQ